MKTMQFLLPHPFFPAAIASLLFTSLLPAQPASNPGENLVINPSFEVLRKGEVLDRANDLKISEAWESPNAGEPLLFTTIDRMIYDPNGSLWPFTARTGKNVAGINVAGGSELEPRREYIQGTLKRPLTVGKKYYFSFYVHYHCEGANNIGIVFLPEKLAVDAPGRLNLNPASYQKNVTAYNNTDRTWTLVRDSFIAYKPFQYFIIGNFFTDENTEVESHKYEHYFAYIDDIEVVEAADSPVKGATPDQAELQKWTENIETVKNKTKLLQNTAETPASPEGERVTVLFGFDSASLQPEAGAVLDALVNSLRQNPDARVRVSGFASSEGTSLYNERLSRRRAAAVRRYLIGQGIPKERIISEAKGENDPAAPNDREENRKKNRRVELVLE